MGLRAKKRLVREKPEPLSVPYATDDSWSMGFIHDQHEDGQSYRLFLVINDFNREGLTMDIDFSLPTTRVIRSFDQIIEWRGKPKQTRCDNGSGCISVLLAIWAENHDTQLKFIQPGSPQQNAKKWLWTYNNEPPNIAIGVSRF